MNMCVIVHLVIENIVLFVQGRQLIFNVMSKYLRKSLLIIKYILWKFPIVVGVLEGCVASTLCLDVIPIFMLINNSVYLFTCF
jgi:hypothetical protein